MDVSEVVIASEKAGIATQLTMQVRETVRSRPIRKSRACRSEPWAGTISQSGRGFGKHGWRREGIEEMVEWKERYLEPLNNYSKRQRYTIIGAAAFVFIAIVAGSIIYGGKLTWCPCSRI